ncbi:MAG: hypothetical protein K2F97_10125, partial [Muribaculaceae bacterium]|nr:hypothetical protein [Muribaculaceae bacterium]
AARELKEVVVEGERIIHKPGCDILLLSERNRKIGVNALEAISSLNYFKTSIGDTELISYDGKPVYITINGVPAKGDQLCSYTADQIKRVEYFAVTPAEYMGLTEGPVINVITHRPRTQMVSGYFRALNAVSTFWGTNSGSLTYADSLNRVQAFYNMGYTSTGHDDIDKHSRYEYAPTHIADYLEKGKLVSAWHTLDLVYQRDQGPHMFNATLSGLYEHSKEQYGGVADIVSGITSAGGTSYELSKVHSKSLGLSLYYRFKFRSGANLAFNVTNSLGRSGNDATLLRDIDPPYDALNYDIATDTRNKIYALAASTAYSLPLPNGQFRASFRYRYNRLTQTSLGIDARPETHMTYTSLQYVWMKYGFSVIPSIGLSTIENHTAAGENTSVSPALGLSSTWNAQSKALKGWSVKLNYHLNNAMLGIGNLANSISYIDNDFISMGNPDARPYREHRGSLSVEYMSPDGMNMFRIGCYPGYAHHPLAPVLLPVDGGNMALSYENIRYSYSNGFYMSASWCVLPWLELSPYLDYSYSRNVFHDGRVSFGQWRVGGSAYITKGNFEFGGTFNPPVKRIDGNLFKRASTQA